MTQRRTSHVVTLPPPRRLEASGRGELFVTVLAPSGSFSIALPAKGSLRIGRGEECDVQVDDPQVSRVHAVLQVEGERSSIVDQGSSNGTRMNDASLAPHVPHEVNLGQPIALGDTILLMTRTSVPPPVPALSAPAIIDTRAEARAGEREQATFAKSGTSVPVPAAEAQGRALARLMPTVRRIAGGQIAVLVLGETGVGKEVMARQIHALSPRHAAPLVSINCSALATTLLESELFGHEKGAFTGATTAKPGLLEMAQGGTVFLDEVGELSLDLQAKLLRALEEREVLRVGSLKPRPIDVRFVAATNRDLAAEIEAGRFRRDLYYRLNGVSLEIPPLRERRDEIRGLAEWFVRTKFDGGGSPPRLAEDAIAALEDYAWPGNIRELRNTIERALLLCSGERITAADLLIPREGAPHAGPSKPPVSSSPYEAPAAASTVSERARILEALEACGWNQTRAAERLGISRRTLVSRLTTLDMPRPRKRTPPL